MGPPGLPPSRTILLRQLGRAGDQFLENGLAKDIVYPKLVFQGRQHPAQFMIRKTLLPLAIAREGRIKAREI